MPKPNDPCPCGSGKKYKHCHMIEDRLRETEHLATERAAKELRLALIEFARTESFRKDVADGLKLFWDGHYTIDNFDRMSPDETLRFFDWLIFDYVGLTGKRLIDVYAAEHGSELSEKQRQILAGWQAAPSGSAFKVEDIDDRALHLQDLFSGERYEVLDTVGATHADPDELLLARLVPVDGKLRFSGATGRLPASEAEALKAFLNGKFEEYKSTRPWGQWKDFARGWAYLLIHFALEEAERAGRPLVAAESPQAARIARRAQKAVQRVRRR